MKATIRDPIHAMPDTLVATQQFVQIVRNACDQAQSYEAAEEFVRCAEEMVQSEARVLARRSQVENEHEVARYIHHRVDVAVREMNTTDPETAARVACKRGCNACCYQRVSLASPEAARALAAAERAGHRIDVERARRQAETDFDETLSHADKRCVMLADNGDCAIYEDRPLACRSYRVLDNAEQCDNEARPGARVLAWATPRAEALASAQMRTFRHGTLSAFVVAADREHWLQIKRDDREAFDVPDGEGSDL